MNQQQRERLEEIAQSLHDAFADEADPRRWPGAGQHISEMSKSDRGDRFWCKSNASATASLIMKINSITDRDDEIKASPKHLNMKGPKDADEDIRQYEKAAKRIVDRIAAGK